MRKFYSRVLLAFIVFLFTQTAKAQVSNYAFSQTTGTYTPITGGTVVATATGASGAASLDDLNFTLAAGTIPFNFTFNGTAYTGLVINTNGYITFGATPPSATATGAISSTTGYSGAIAALSRDLNSLFNISGNTGEIRYEVVGSAPNREFVIQYSNFRPFSSSTSTTTYWRWNFQIRLKEDNTISIVYDFNNVGSPTGSTGQVGLRGASNTDFNNRTGSSGWTTTNPGTSNSNTVSYSSTNKPPSGLTFSWGVAALDLSLESIDGLPTSPCPNNSVPISATIKNTGGSAIDFAANNATLTIDITGASTQTLTVTLNNGTLAPGATMSIPVFPNADLSAGGTHSFDGDIVMTGDGNAANNDATASASIVFTSTLPASVDFTGFTGSNLSTVFPGWREGDGATAPNGTTSSWINRTGLGDAANVTAKVNLFTTTATEWIVGPRFLATASTVFQYEVAVTDFGSVTAPAVMGSDDRVSVMVSTDCGITWTEVNAYTVADNISNSLTPQSVNLGAYAGQNIMVAFKATDGPVNDIEDYDFHVDNFLIGEACTGTPTGGTTNASQATVCIGGSTNLSLSGASSIAGITYQWQSSTDNITFNDIAGANGSSYSTAAIQSNTYYRAKVTCSNGGAFDFSGSILISTAPPLTAPVTEGFETLSSFGAGVVPSCWSTELTNGTNFTSANAPVRNSLGARTGTNYVWARWSSDAWLFTPAMQLTAGTSYDFSFWYRQTDAIAGFTLTAAVGSLNSAAGMTTTLGTITDPVNTDYEQAKYTFTPTVTGIYYFGLRSNSPGSAPWYMTYDDFAVELTPPCSPPNDVTFSLLTNNSASVNFTATGTSYIVEYGLTGFTPGTGATPGTGGTIVTGTGSPVALTGLTSNTGYDVYVRQVCGAVYSVNSNVQSFTTLCDATAVPYSENFNAATLPNLPECTTRENLNGATTWTTVTAPTGYTGRTLRYSWDGTLPGDDWFYTRALNLTGGSTYRLVYRYGNNSTSFEESLGVFYGSSNTAASMTNLLADHPVIDDNTPHQDTVYFTPATTGVYYIGFHAYSIADQLNLFLDDISVVKAPLVDVSPVALITPPTTCPINMATIQATIQNTSIFPLDLALNPVTINATVSGTGTGSLTATANTGTIAPGASLDVTLTPTFNFSTGGNYVFTVTTTQALDENASNDSYTTTIVVNQAPTMPTVTPAAPTVCAGNTQLLTASGSIAPTTGTITGTSPTTSTGQYSPFYRLWEGSRRQYMIRASELTAMGLSSGSAIHSVSFNITNAPNPSNLNNFNLKVATTTQADLSSAFVTGATTVYTNPNYLPVAGANTFNFSSAITWDGTSNLVIEICWDNDPDNSCNAGSPTCWGNTPGVSMATAPFAAATREIHDDNDAGTRDMCTMTSTSNSTGTSTLRPVMVLGYMGASSYTWSPSASLFTDAAGTIAYTGTPSETIYAKPTTNTTYTLTATSAAGCITTTSVTVNITPVTEIVTQPAATVSACVGGPVTFSVGAAGAGLTYQWRKGGVNIAGATSATYTINNVSYADAGSYSVVVTGTCAPVVTSDNSVLTVTDNNWVGTSNSDWSNPLNWCGGVPTAAMSVTIPSGTPFSPVIAGNAPVNNITINTGATLQVTASGRLILHGALTNNGTLNSTAGTIEFMGASNQTVPAITAANIIVNGAGGVTLAGDMNIGTALTLTNGNITLGNYNLTMTGGTVGSVSSHIVTNGTGRVTNNNVGTVTVVFPVGATATTYNPVMIANGQGRNYTVGVATGLPTTPALANGARAVNRTWNVTVNTAPTSPVNVSMQYADADVNASATPTANMQVGVSNGTSWLIATPAAGVAPTGTASGRVVGFQTVSFGPMVVSNIGGINFPTAVNNVDADVTGIMLMPNIVNDMTVLRVKTLRTTKVDWTVIDGNGRVVMAFSKQVFAGQNDIQLSLGRLAAGSYQLVGQTSKGKVQSVQFVRL